MKMFLGSRHLSLMISVGFILITCTSCNGLVTSLTAPPSPKEIDIDSATKVEFPSSWPRLKSGMSRQEFSQLPFVKSWLQLIEEQSNGIIIKKAVYSFDFYEYFFIDNSLTEASAKNNCQYFSDHGGAFAAFFPVSIPRAKEMLVNSAKPLGFAFSSETPNKIVMMAWATNKIYYTPSLDSNYDRYTYNNNHISNSAAPSSDDSLQPEQVLTGTDFRHTNNGGVKSGKMVGGSGPAIGFSYDGILHAEFKKSGDGTMVYVETDSRHIVMKSRHKSVAKSILMHIDCSAP